MEAEQASVATPMGKHWTDSAAWYVLPWVFTVFCAPVGVACIVIGIIRAAQGRGHGVWINGVCAFAVSVVISIAIRMNA